MKKLKKFNLKECRQLNNDEMRMIIGGGLYDTPNNQNDPKYPTDPNGYYTAPSGGQYLTQCDKKDGSYSPTNRENCERPEDCYEPSSGYYGRCVIVPFSYVLKNKNI